MLASRSQLFGVFSGENVSLQIGKVHHPRAGPSHPSRGVYLVGDESIPYRRSE